MKTGIAVRFWQGYYNSLACCLLSLASGVTFASDGEFEQLANDYLASLPKLSPVNATAMGDHRADAQIDNVSTAGRSEYRKQIGEFRERLDDIDWSALSPGAQIDAAMLGNDLDKRIFNIDTLQEWAWNPVYYVNISGSALYGLMARDFAPLETRLINAAARMRMLPRFLQHSREALQPDRVPKIHAETAIAQNTGVLSIIESMIAPHIASLAPNVQTEIRSAINIATEAVQQHQEWLEVELLPRSAGDFRIGTNLFDRKLQFTLESSLGRKQISARAESEYVRVRNEMYEAAKAIYAKRHPYASFPDMADESFKQVIIRAALEQAYAQLPARDEIIEIAKQYLQQATDFVIEKNIVTVPEEPLEIIVMPEFQRGVTVAYLDPAGPLETNAETFYAVAPLPAQWSPEQVNSFLREYNLLSIQDLTIHEAMPGHYLQLALSNRYPSALRSVLWSDPFVEGWAVYAERVMVDEGYLNHDPLMRLINLKWYLRTITNAIIDQAIHVDGMTRDAAMKLMIEGGFQEESEAAGKWVRAQLTSTQLSTYFVGYQEHLDMRKAVEVAWGDEFTLRRYHDQALSYGSPSVKYVRALMLGTAIPRDSPQ